jgi:hypothetical protein
MLCFLLSATTSECDILSALQKKTAAYDAKDTGDYTNDNCDDSQYHSSYSGQSHCLVNFLIHKCLLLLEIPEPAGKSGHKTDFPSVL